MGSVCSSQPPQMCWFSLQRSARGLFAEVSPCHFLLFSLQLHPGLLLAAVSSPVRSQLGELRGSDGVLPAFGVGEHPVLHPGLPAHRHLQCHDPEGQCWGENLCRKRFWGVRSWNWCPVEAQMLQKEVRSVSSATDAANHSFAVTEHPR